MADDHFLEGILNEDGTPIWSQQTSQYVSQFGEQASPVEEISPSSRLSKRSKKFTKDEDNMLVSAYLAISLDPVQGNDQSGRTYWNRMHNFFHLHKEFNSDRGEKFLSNRLAVIMKDTSLFKGYYDKIQLRNQSGTSESDKIVQALAMYSSKEKKPFSFLHCWNTLKHQQKWIDRPSTIGKRKEKIIHASSSGMMTPETDSSQNHDTVGLTTTDEEPMRMQRPPGRKAEKERRRGKSSTSQSDNHYMEAMNNLWTKRKESDDLKESRKKERHDEKIRVELERVEDEKRNTEIRQIEIEEKIMAKDTSSMSETQRLYYETMQKDIVAKRLGSRLG